MKIIKVEWVDAQTQTNRLNLESIKSLKDAETISIGFLVDENNFRISICSWIHTFDDGDLYCDVHTIPKSIIKKMTVLEDEKKNDM